MKVSQLEIITRRIVAQLNQEERGNAYYTFKSYSYGWILEVNKSCKQKIMPPKNMRIFGYTFPLNEASVAEICTDKAACSAILSEYNIPCVAHKLFIRPSLVNYTPSTGILRPALEYAEKVGYPLIAKIKDGTGGTGVYRIFNARELEVVAMSIFTAGKDMCLSPYYEIMQEYRAIVLDNEVQICFSKERSTIVGNGKATLATLLSELLLHTKLDLSTMALSIKDAGYKLATVLQRDEVLFLNWKHNLGLGSTPRLTSTNAPFTSLAIQAARAIGLRFGSVDIIEIAHPSHPYQILEINSGVMLENFISHYQEYQGGYSQAFDLYKKAIVRYFETR